MLSLSDPVAIWGTTFLTVALFVAIHNAITETFRKAVGAVLDIRFVAACLTRYGWRSRFLSGA